MSEGQYRAFLSLYQTIRDLARIVNACERQRQMFAIRALRAEATAGLMERERDYWRRKAMQ